MRGAKKLILTLLVLVLGVGAGFFAFPQMANSLLARVPFLSLAVPERPFLLGLDLQGGLHLVYEADLSSISGGERDEAMEGLRDVIERRVNLFGVQEPVVQVEGTRLVVELAGIENPQRALEIIGQTPYLEFRELREDAEEVQQRNLEILEGELEIELQDPFLPTELTGRYLEKAALGFGQIANEPIIELQFNDEGAALFGEITKRSIGRRLPIYLDGQLLSAPVVQEEIGGGKAEITGVGSLQDAREIVRNLNAGALPVPITILFQERVGAQLGMRSLEDSLKAGIVGFALIIVFMLLFYRLPGFLASLALLFYVALVLALFKAIPVTLTLAGIAGCVLSLGMAVDANILIFSRMREELKNGRGLAAATEEGFRRAWPSIRDGNITTLLVAVILYWLGSSFVQGFAFTLSLGILLSMFTALVVTRGLLRLFEGSVLANMRWLWR